VGEWYKVKISFANLYVLYLKSACNPDQTPDNVTHC